MTKKAEMRKKPVSLTPEMWEMVKSKLFDGWSLQKIDSEARKDHCDLPCSESLYHAYYDRMKRVMDGESDEKLPLLPKEHLERVHRPGYVAPAKQQKPRKKPKKAGKKIANLKAPKEKEPIANKARPDVYRQLLLRRKYMVVFMSIGVFGQEHDQMISNGDLFDSYKDAEKRLREYYAEKLSRLNISEFNKPQMSLFDAETGQYKIFCDQSLHIGAILTSDTDMGAFNGVNQYKANE